MPPGHVPAELTIGSFSERTFVDISMWSRDDYLEHWRETARRCLTERSDVVFCASISKSKRESVMLWPAFWRNDSVVFFNWLARRSSLRISGLKIFLKARMSEPVGEVSRWEVPAAYLERLANAVA